MFEIIEIVILSGIFILLLLFATIPFNRFIKDETKD